MEVRRITVAANGLRFAVDECGAGDRLALLLHGFPEHPVSWRHQLPALAALGLRVWAPAQRGYGDSSRPAGVRAYRVRRLMEDVAGLIDAAGARSVALVGHDWGAMVAWCFAAARMRPIDRLAILNVPHPLCFRRALRHWRQLRKSWYIGFFQVPGLPDRLLAARDGAAVRRIFLRTGQDPACFPPDVLDTYARNAAAPGAATAMLNWYRTNAALLVRPPAFLRRPIEVPTLLVWGEEDVALDLLTLRGTERHVRDLTLRRLPGVSHWVQQEAPGPVNAMLAAFLRGEPVPDPTSDDGSSKRQRTSS